MEHETKLEKDYLTPASIAFAAVLIAGALVYSGPQEKAAARSVKTQGTELEERVLPPQGIVLPVRWGDLGAKMVSVGVIDGEKFEKLYANRGGLTGEVKQLLYGGNYGNLKITPENSGVVLNLLWALGLGAKNDILERGEMTNPQYGGDAARFASTGGWTLAKGSAMDHYSRHPLIVLTQEQQELVERVSKNIYRPCCNNSTHFPDCNHGMAMLGLLELMASQGVSEEDIYKVALQVNAYWFPDTYLTIAKYLESKGIAWKDAVPKEILGKEYSSVSGFRNISSKVAPVVPSGGGGGCGIDAGAPVAPQRQPSGCGI